MWKVVMIGAVVALTGCANMQEVNDSLKKLNSTLSSARTVEVGKLGDGTGFQPVLRVEIPGDVCNRQAFIDGYKDNFVKYWNQNVFTKIMQLDSEAVLKPKDANVKANRSMYKEHMIGTKNVRDHMQDYPLDFSVNADNCAFRGYQKGQSAGIDAVRESEKTLIPLER